MSGNRRLETQRKGRQIPQGSIQKKGSQAKGGKKSNKSKMKY